MPDSQTLTHSAPPATSTPWNFEPLQRFARFYPVNPNKKPAVAKGELEPTLTANAGAIRCWQMQGYGIGAVINSDSDVFFLDLESPTKHATIGRDGLLKLGPDGRLTLYSKLEEYGITLPPAPTTGTPTGGLHIALRTPKGRKVEECIGLWPGVDILAGGSKVLMPGTKTHNGEYTTLRGFGEIPEAPKAFIDLLNGATLPKKKQPKCLTAAPESAETTGVSARQWWMLKRNHIFRKMWNRTKQQGDLTNSCYEFWLGVRCYAIGLDEDQAVAVVRAWWKHHSILSAGREKKLRKAILPASWRKAEPYVTEYRTKQAARKGGTQLPCITTPVPLLRKESALVSAAGRHLSESSRRVLALRAEMPTATNSEIAAAAQLPRRHVALILKRHGAVVETKTDQGSEQPAAAQSVAVGAVRRNSSRAKRLSIARVVIQTNCVPPVFRLQPVRSKGEAA